MITFVWIGVDRTFEVRTVPADEPVDAVDDIDRWWNEEVFGSGDLEPLPPSDPAKDSIVNKLAAVVTGTWDNPRQGDQLLTGRDPDSPEAIVSVTPDVVAKIRQAAAILGWRETTRGQHMDDTVYMVIDVETSGTETTDSALLEVACWAVDENLVRLDEKGFHAVIHHNRELADVVRKQAVPVVQDMHDANGLWAKLPNGVPLAEAEGALLAYIKQFAPRPRQAMIVGNSPILDSNFLKAFMPKVHGHLHYRFIDVSTLEHVSVKWLKEKPFHKDAQHTADGDVAQCVAQLRHLRTVIKP